MTTGEYTPLLRDGSNRSSATQHHLPINAHYYDITDLESWPIAGLLVMLDGQSQPVRAELHLYDDLEPPVQDAAVRQARVVLQERYLGGQPVPVRILETLQIAEEMLVRLPPVGTREVGGIPPIRWKWRPYGMIGAAILVLVALIWVVSALIGSGKSTDASETVAATPTGVSQPSGGEQVAEATSAEAEGEADNGGGAVEAPATTSDLPPSQNPRADLGIGMRVKVVEGLRVALRSEPGADRGIVVGEMSDGIVGTIVGGPEYSQGDSDTIVWWFVTLPNSTSAWAAANTSQKTLLLPAE